MASCYKCSKPIMAGIESPLPVDAVCEQCSSWLHACANCAFYDEYSHSKCRESKAEYIFDRLGKNTCPFFKLKESAEAVQKKMSPRAEAKEREGRARDNLERLFRK